MKDVDIIEYGDKGFIGETVLRCFAYNEIKEEMEGCEDFNAKGGNKNE